MGSRSQNVSRNIKFGLAYKIVTLLLPFLTRTVLLYLLGTTSLGVSTLFTSILSFLSLAELGLGSAVVYTMYKPIAENDLNTLCALLNYYRKLYRLIGLVVLAIGILISPFLPFLIKGDVPAGLNLYVLYYLYLANSVISYFFAGYRQSLLTAHQRADIRDKIAMCITVAVRVFEIIVIILFKNLYLYIIVTIIGTIATNIITSAVTKRMFPNIRCKGQVSSDIRLQIRKRLGGLFGTKLNSIVVHQADTLVISTFLGLTMVAQYGNYYYILNAISGFVMILFSSMTASIGNKMATESKDKVYELFKNINFINYWIVSWCSICMACLYRPFMLIWVKEELTLPILMSILMALYFYVFQIQRTLLTFKDAGGLWYEDRFRPYVSMILNVVSNIILVQFAGIYGIVISTIIALMISVPWCNYVVFKYMFNKSAAKNIIDMLTKFAFTIFAGLITYSACLFENNGISGLILRALICLLLPNVMFFIIYNKKPEFKYMKQITRNFITKKRGIS